LPQTRTGEELREAQPLTPTQLAWRRFRRHRMAMFGVLLLGLLLLYVTVGGLILSRGLCTPINKIVTGEAYANCNDIGIKLQAPSAWHLFGTDTIGQDILART